MWASPPGFEGKTPEGRTGDESPSTDRPIPTQLVGAAFLLHPARMPGSDPQVLIFAVVILGTVISLLGSLTTWVLSRAKHMASLEQSVLNSLSTQELKLAEWQTTIKAMLAEVEDFFDRSVKERKRAVFASTKAEAAAAAEPQVSLENMSHLPRAMQLEMVRQHFDGH